MRHWIMAIALVLPAAAWADEAQITCVDPVPLMKALETKYHEMPVWNGASGKNDIMIMTHAPDNGTWTMVLITRHDGRVLGCIVAAGDDGNPITPTTKGGE